MLKKNIIFLDFDGVLHPTSAGPEELFIKSNELMECLLPFRHDCKIIISSSWRLHYSINELKELISPELGEMIDGKTGDAFIGQWPRYNEIKEYLKLYSPFANWRALDDSFLEFPPDCPELIKCNPNTGLSNNELLQLQRWLKQ
jgi:hypothetical protein